MVVVVEVEVEEVSLEDRVATSPPEEDPCRTWVGRVTPEEVQAG